MSTSQTNDTWYNVAYNGKLPAKTNMLSFHRRKNEPDKQGLA